MDFDQLEIFLRFHALRLLRLIPTPEEKAALNKNAAAIKEPISVTHV